MTERDQTRDARRDEDDLAPGIAEPAESRTGVAIAGYLVGLALSIVLTVASFYTLGTPLVWRAAIPIALVVLAIAQIGVHLVFFLHLTTAPDNTNNALALAFGVLIVILIVAGSLWIMDHLNHNMMSMYQVMRMQR
ncbi:MAG TPA: cytochrome o ubiquinol oxidase subunit IV [Casimicrobiaceae bacterium]|nr:cytochrome o ubiquinol oxidase subunit IV [Casimicrobiaceae bacterium]